MYIKVRVFPKNKNERVEETGKNRFSVYVREPAENNRANKRMIELIARHLEVDPHLVNILSGHHSPSKMLSINFPAQG